MSTATQEDITASAFNEDNMIRYIVGDLILKNRNDDFEDYVTKHNYVHCSIKLFFEHSTFDAVGNAANIEDFSMS